MADSVDVLAENIMLQPPTAAGFSQSASPLDEMSLVDINIDHVSSSSNVLNMSTNTHVQQSSRDRPILPAKQTPSSASTSSSSDSVTAPSSTKRNTKKRPAAIDSSHSNSSALDSEEERILEKRRRNTLAARRFRQRKQDHVAALEAQLAAVTKERDELRLQIAKWEGEVTALRKMLEGRKG
ncbi:hypothetical protein VTN96DRAFT_9952 [Rasamsonia emersonii]